MILSKIGTLALALGIALAPAPSKADPIQRPPAPTAPAAPAAPATQPTLPYATDLQALGGLAKDGKIEVRFTFKTPPGFQTMGLSDSNLETACEAQLRSSGIPITTEDAQTAYGAGLPEIVFSLSAFGNEDAPDCTYCTRAQVNEFGLVFVNGVRSICVVTTWQSPEEFGYAGPTGSSTIKDALLDQVTAFVNDYLTENPRP